MTELQPSKWPKPPYEDKEGKQKFRASKEEYLKILDLGPFPQPICWPSAAYPSKRWVYKLEAEGSEPVYYKMVKNAVSDGVLEKLALKFAQHFGLFAELVPYVYRDKVTRNQNNGLLQNQAYGKSLLEMKTHYSDKYTRIPILTLAKGALCCAVLGTNDANGENIFIDERSGNPEQWQVKLIDNERFLSPSNEVIYWGNKPFPFFRCSLLGAPQAGAILSDQERATIHAWLVEIKDSLPELKTYLDSERVQQTKIAKIQKGFDLKISWDALEERVKQLLASSASESPKSLRQLLCDANRAYQFHVGLLFAKYCHAFKSKQESSNPWDKEEFYINKAFIDSGMASLPSIMEEIGPYCDVNQIKELALDTKMPLSEFFTKIQGLMVSTPCAEYGQASQKFLHESLKKAVYDATGKNDQLTRENHANLILDLIKAEGLPSVTYKTLDEVRTFENQMQPLGYACIGVSGDFPSLFIGYKNFDSTLGGVELDYWSRTGFVKIIGKSEMLNEGEFYTVAEVAARLKKWFHEQTTHYETELCQWLEEEGYQPGTSPADTDKPLKTYVVIKNGSDCPYVTLFDLGNRAPLSLDYLHAWMKREREAKEITATLEQCGFPRLINSENIPVWGVAHFWENGQLFLCFKNQNRKIKMVPIDHLSKPGLFKYDTSKSSDYYELADLERHFRDTLGDLQRRHQINAKRSLLASAFGTYSQNDKKTFEHLLQYEASLVKFDGSMRKQWQPRRMIEAKEMDYLGFNTSFCSVSLSDASNTFQILSQKNSRLEVGKAYTAEELKKGLVVESILAVLEKMPGCQVKCNENNDLILHFKELNGQRASVQVNYWTYPEYLIALPSQDASLRSRKLLPLAVFLKEITLPTLKMPCI